MSLKSSIQSFINNLNDDFEYKKQKNYKDLDEDDNALIIGTSQYGDVAFNTTKLLANTRCLIVGTSGSGKSYFTRNIIESIYNHRFTRNDGSEINKIIQIHDPEGEFYTLRESEDFDFLIFGRGEFCDVEINPENAAEYALKTLENRINCIIDYTTIPENNEKYEIASTWNETLLAASSKIRTHLFLFIDEAHKWATKGNSDPLNIRSKISLKQLAQTGRRRGIVTFFITQRVTHLHTDIYAECNNFLIGKTNIETDIRRNGELLGIHSPKKQQVFKTLSKEFIARGESFVHNDDSKLSSEIIKCVSNSPSSKHENIDINDPLFFKPSSKVKEWIKIFNGNSNKSEEKDENIAPNNINKIRELRLQKMETEKIIKNTLETNAPETNKQEEIEKEEYVTPPLAPRKKPLKLEWESDPIHIEPEQKNLASVPELVDTPLEKGDEAPELPNNSVLLPVKAPSTPVEKSLTNNFNTSSASKIILENTFNVWFHIISFFESISLQNLYILSIRDDYNAISAEMEIKLFCKQNKDLFVIQDDTIWWMPKNPEDEIKKSNLQISKSDYFIKLWKHKLNNSTYERILVYLYEDENNKNRYEEIAKNINVEIKDVKNFITKYSKCGLIKDAGGCVYLNTIFFHNKIHDSFEENIMIEHDEKETNEPDHDDPDFDSDDDYDDDFEDDEEFEDE